VEESEQAPPADLPVVSGPVGGGYRDQVLEIMRQLPPSGFEQLCQRIMRESGFQQVKVTGRSGDGGIDGVGVLQINPFVTFKVLFQSKRYAGPVSAAQVRDFRGAMMGRADKGLMITTGTFTADAQAEAVRDGVPPIELVDGQGLVSLLEQLELGLTPRRTFSVDPRFFDEFGTTR
jgi:restriction system protein